MRNSYREKLEKLHTQLIEMGSLCEEAIECAVGGLIKDDPELRKRAVELEHDIDIWEHDIEAFCVLLLFREQPVASDLRQITAAQRMINDMERIGDQAEDIAHLAAEMSSSTIKSDVNIVEMTTAIIKMLKDSVDSFIENDLEKAKSVIVYDQVVNALFDKVKNELIGWIRENSDHGAECLNLLMVAKYLERIGDHAQNIAEWVKYSITGVRKDWEEQYVR
jgi:phosphate transport system protein